MNIFRFIYFLKTL